MKLLTRQTDYAVRALACIAGNQGITTAAELVEKTGIPRPFLRKLLLVLSKKKILRSYKGTGGGVELAVKPEKLRLSELMEIFQGPLRLNQCVFKKKECPNCRMCRLRRRIGSIEAMVINQLRMTTLKDIISN